MELALNDELHVDPKLRAFGDWRGPLAPSWEDKACKVANHVVNEAMIMARQLVGEPVA